MHDAVPVRFRQSQPDLIENIGHQRKGNPRIVVLKVGERPSIQKLHHQVGHVAAIGAGDPEIGDVDDVGVAQTAARLRFALEPREKLRFRRPLGSDHFDRNHPRGAQVRRQVHISHPACAQLFVDPVF
jgi:hypothetical protein